MQDNPFQVLGPSVPTMVGRRSTIERIQNHLDRDQPEHVSVIGPARYGKSVILSELERRYAPGCPGYHTAVYLDLRLYTPETDDELRQQIADELQKVFADSWADITELLKFEDVELRERMQLVGRELAQTDDRVLLIMDGFDEVLANPGITRAIWDGLLRIADLPVLRLVTGSRRPLRELCVTEESRTSDFWEIFHDVPVVVGGFDEEDWSALIKTFVEAGVEIDTSARGALVQWTGNVPVLTVALLQSLWEEVEADAVVNSTEIDRLAERLLGRRRQILNALWEDCSAEMKTDLADLGRRELRVREVPEVRLIELERRGFVERRGKRLVSSCRLMERFAGGQAAGVNSLQRLFGEEVLFDDNIRMLLEMRLSQVPIADETLRGYVEQAIRHLQPEPRHALVWVRSIVDRAQDFIWGQEHRDGVTMPDNRIKELQRAGVQNLPDDGHGRVPGERGRQMRLLRFATGTSVGGRTLRRLAKRVTKPTAILLDHMQSVGNFGQHQEDKVSKAFAVSVCMSAISLCASLAEDYGPSETATQDALD
jgi:hypothetical protein